MTHIEILLSKFIDCLTFPIFQTTHKMRWHHKKEKLNVPFKMCPILLDIRHSYFYVLTLPDQRWWTYIYIFIEWVYFTFLTHCLKLPNKVNMKLKKYFVPPLYFLQKKLSELNLLLFSPLLQPLCLNPYRVILFVVIPLFHLVFEKINN